MKVFVRYPTDDDGKSKMQEAVAQIYAVITMKKIENLNLDSESKKRVLKKVLEIVKERAINEQKQIKLNAGA